MTRKALSFPARAGILMPHHVVVVGAFACNGERMAGLMLAPTARQAYPGSTGLLWWDGKKQSDHGRYVDKNSFIVMTMNEFRTYVQPHLAEVGRDDVLALARTAAAVAEEAIHFSPASSDWWRIKNPSAAVAATRREREFSSVLRQAYG